MNEHTKKIKIAALVEDLELYPRTRVDTGHVGDLVRALEAGAGLPPIIVDAKSKSIIDGFHRVRAYRRLLGDGAEIDAEMRRYKTREEMLLDAIHLNSAHGRKLDRLDQAHIVLLCDGMGIPSEQIALRMHVTAKKVEELRIRIVVNSDTKESVPIKRGGEWMRGRSVTTAQIESGIKPVRSMEVGRLCKELGRLIEHDLVNWEDASVVRDLEVLQTALSEAIEKHAVSS